MEPSSLLSPFTVPFSREVTAGQSLIQFHRSYLNFTYHLFIVPFRFKYDVQRRQYTLHGSRLHMVLCIIFQLSSLLYIRTTFTAGWDYVREGTDPISYFDLMFLVLLYGFDISTKYVFWCHSQNFKTVVDLLQDEKVQIGLQSSFWTASRVRWLIYGICTLYTLPSALYIALVLGVDPTNGTGLLEAIKGHAEQVFMVAFGDHFPILRFLQQTLAVVLTLYTSAFWHYCDVFVLVSVLFMHRAAMNFFDALDRGEIEDSEVISQYESFKRLNNACSNVAGWAVNIFLTYPLSYYATHLVDMLNNSELMNRFTMCIYLGNLSLSMMLAASINMRAQKSISNWIRRHSTGHIDAPQLSLILFEIRNGEIGLSGFFTVTIGFAGDIVNLLLTLTVITIQFKISQ